MTKYKRKTIQRSVGRMVTTKSWFGSHEEMVVDPCDAEELEPNVRWAVLKEDSCTDIASLFYVKLHIADDDQALQVGTYTTQNKTH